MSILGRLGAPSWGHFRPFWRPSSAKLRPKRVLEAYLHQKREFSRNTTPADTAAIFGAPRWRPKWPKIGPRRPQEALEDDFLALENRLKICLVLGVDFGRFWAPKWDPKTLDASLFWGLEVALFLHVVFMLFWIAPKTTQEIAKTPQEAAKTALDESQKSQNTFQDLPK